MPPQTSLRVPATPAGLRQAVGALEAFSSAESLPQELRWRLQVAVDEVLSNVVRHGGATGIETSFRREADIIEITLADDGTPFDPASWPAPDVQSSLEYRRPGGLGLALVKSLIEEIDYHRRDDRNVLTLRTRIAARRAPQGN